MTHSFNQTAWREAATGGLYMGLTYAILSIAGYMMRAHTGVASLTNALSFFSVAGFLYVYANRVGVLQGAAGFTFGQSFRFILRVSLFGGIIAGVGMFALYNWIDPEGTVDQLDLTGKMLVQNGWDEKTVEEGLTGTRVLMKNPLMVIFGGIMQMTFFGGMLGLIISWFVRRPAQPTLKSSDSVDSL